MRLLFESGLSLAPVLAFLFALQLVDTYRLVTLRRVLRTVAVGGVVALLCYALNSTICTVTGLSVDTWARSGAPLVEEVAKALYIWWLIRSHRVGFMVDSAICGFATGAGFAVVENIFYLLNLSGIGLLTYAVRGFGTAVMHGGTTAIFALISRNRAEMRRSHGLAVFVPGLALAILIHLIYNQPALPPTVSAGLFVLLLPVFLYFVFWRSEKALEKWMGVKLDKDVDILHMIATDTFSASPAGSYLRSLEHTFPPKILADMICYVQLSAELSARAKGDLLRREMGFPVVATPELRSQLTELAFLESRIGRAGKLALAPLLGASHLDIWELNQLAET
ncbi:MAG: PrsW family intramembrane metalloprotease [Acidobacteriaceae bacterium]|nr:PrsW family intramembrane metalloprotease [Acidobacteriaceae bacterium]